VSVAAAVFFFVVVPVNALMARSKTEPPVDETVRDCPEPERDPGGGEALRVLHRRGRAGEGAGLVVGARSARG
jgi:hypothetical protein